MKLDVELYSYITICNATSLIKEKFSFFYYMKFVIIAKFLRICKNIRTVMFDQNDNSKTIGTFR